VDAPSRPARLAAVVLAGWAVHVGLGLAAARANAPVFDEPVHLASGYNYLVTGRPAVNFREHPPFAEAWSAVPLLAMGLDPGLDRLPGRSVRPLSYGNLFLYGNSRPPMDMLFWARAWTLASWSLLALSVLAWWAARLGGAAAAAAAVGAYAFSPAFLANGPLAMTDFAPAVLAFAAAAALAARGRPGAPRGLVVLAGVLCGLAAASKLSMLAWPFILAAARALEARLEGRAPAEGVRDSAVVLACAAAVLLAVYGGGWEALRAALDSSAGKLAGRPSFLLGRHGGLLLKLFFPVAFLAKTPPATLAFGAVGALALLRRLKGTPALSFLLLPPAAYFAMACASGFTIGHRHILPVYPFWLAAAGVGAAELWRRGRGARAVVLALALWQVLEVGAQARRPISYFNSFFGGPSRASRLMADSSLDMGQGLLALAAELRARGNPAIYLSYFGTADPGAHGVRHVRVAPVSAVDWFPEPARPLESGRALLAVSATNLRGVYYSDRALFAWLESRRPAAVVDHTIFLYDLTGDHDGLERLAGLIERGASIRSSSIAGEDLPEAAFLERRARELEAARELRAWAARPR
jgi:hypothetical protein